MYNELEYEQIEFREQIFKRHILALIKQLNNMELDAYFSAVFKSMKICVRTKGRTVSHEIDSIETMYGDLLYFCTMGQNIQKGIVDLNSLLNMDNFFQDLDQIEKDIIGSVYIKRLNDHLNKRVFEARKKILEQKEQHPTFPLTITFFNIRITEKIK